MTRCPLSCDVPSNLKVQINQGEPDAESIWNPGDECLSARKVISASSRAL
jgi:hypothetical protein